MGFLHRSPAPPSPGHSRLERESFRGYKKSQEVRIGSERNFGLVFAVVFATIAVWPVIWGASIRLWPIPFALGFAIVAFAWPAALRPLNVAWFRLGLLIGTITTPVVMALLYLTTFVPTGLVLRLLGRDVLGLRRESEQASYWVVRKSTDQSSMKRQF